MSRLSSLPVSALDDYDAGFKTGRGAGITITLFALMLGGSVLAAILHWAGVSVSFSFDNPFP